MKFYQFHPLHFFFVPPPPYIPPLLWFTILAYTPATLAFTPVGFLSFYLYGSSILLTRKLYKLLFSDQQKATRQVSSLTIRSTRELKKVLFGMDYKNYAERIEPLVNFETYKKPKAGIKDVVRISVKKGEMTTH